MKQRGFIQIPLLIGLVILVVTIPVGVKLVQQRTQIESEASIDAPCKSCSGTTCKTIASPPQCHHSFNECSNNYDCGYTPPTNTPIPPTPTDPPEESFPSYAPLPTHVPTYTPTPIPPTPTPIPPTPTEPPEEPFPSYGPLPTHACLIIGAYCGPGASGSCCSTLQCSNYTCQLKPTSTPRPIRTPTPTLPPPTNTPIPPTPTDPPEESYPTYAPLPTHVPTSIPTPIPTYSPQPRLINRPLGATCGTSDIFIMLCAEGECRDGTCQLPQATQTEYRCGPGNMWVEQKQPDGSWKKIQTCSTYCDSKTNSCAETYSPDTALADLTIVGEEDSFNLWSDPIMAVTIEQTYRDCVGREGANACQQALDQASVTGDHCVAYCQLNDPAKSSEFCQRECEYDRSKILKLSAAAFLGYQAAVLNPALVVSLTPGVTLAGYQQQTAIKATLDQSSDPGMYIPALDKFIKEENDLLIDAETGSPLSEEELSDHLMYLDKRIARSGFPYTQYVVVTPETFQSPVWQELKTSIQSSTVNTENDISAITNAVHEYLTYNEFVLATFQAPSNDSNLVETGIKSITDVSRRLGGYSFLPSRTLEDMIAGEKTICFEFAVTEHAYLASLGIESQIVGSSTMDHVFLLVGDDIVVDPTWNLIMTLEEHQDTHSYDDLFYDSLFSSFSTSNQEATVIASLREQLTYCRDKPDGFYSLSSSNTGCVECLDGINWDTDLSNCKCLDESSCWDYCRHIQSIEKCAGSCAWYGCEPGGCYPVGTDDSQACQSDDGKG